MIASVSAVALFLIMIIFTWFSVDIPTGGFVEVDTGANAFQAFDEFFNILSTFGTYPPYARPPLVYLYYTALGQGQDFGHGSAGAIILTLIIAIVAVVQGRLTGIGRAAD